MDELPKERLATTDERGKRVYLYPSSVLGKYNTLREKTRYVLIAIFLLIPWLKVGGKQAIFLNVAERRFNFFGYVLWAHDAPMVFFVFGTFALTIAFITAVWGRFWCGWACPQTVFVEGVYRKIENLIEGTPAARRVLDRSPWNGEKVFKKSLKYFLFLLVSLIITHSFLAYFVGSAELAKMIASPPSENLTSFLVILFSTGIIFFDFAWFKEQFCVIACPYGRLQSVLMDDNSLIVAYDEKRGEPRLKKGIAGVKFGDCVSCNRCVQACPTGIDIRRGVQMECIACTACIDACSEVMTKNNRPTGLIRYTTRNELQGLGTKKIHARTKIYLGMIFVFLSVFIFVISKHERLQLTFLRAKDIPYQTIEQNGVKIAINHFKVEIANQHDTDREITFFLSDADKNIGYKLATQMVSYTLRGGESRKIDFFIEVPVKSLDFGHANLRIYYRDQLNKVRSEDLRVVGPFN